MRLLLLIILLFPYTLKAKNNFYIRETKYDSLLFGIQTKIEKTFEESSNSKDITALLDINQSLENLYKTNKQNLIIYWQSYSQMYLSLYYMTSVKDKKSGEREIKKGIKLLKNIKNKNTEDYALLAYLQLFSIVFNPSMAVFTSQKSTKNATNSIMIDSTNIRGYYVLANNDFYTPKVFGGGKKVEKYLLKTILLPTQKIKNNYLPSWGGALRYILLIKFYIREEQWGKAKKYYQEAIQLYPTDKQITELSEKLALK